MCCKGVIEEKGGATEDREGMVAEGGKFTEGGLLATTEAMWFTRFTWEGSEVITDG